MPIVTLHYTLGGEGSGGAKSISFESDRLLSAPANVEIAEELLTVVVEALDPERFRRLFNLCWMTDYLTT